ncbi:MAG: ATP-binding protein [Pseudomonadota bacterium]
MYNRDLSTHIQQLSKDYPVVTVTGPRQSGKTTIVKSLFSEKPYISLENIDEREFAKQDPKGFLNQFKSGAILDEAQYAPDLFSYIQTRVDNNQKPGEFILTGSQNFLLLEKISQSLAGRTAILHLLPLSYAELKPYKQLSLDEFICSGGYPRIHANNLNPNIWIKNYINTYIERDVRQIKNITDLSKFQLFIRLCAGRIGQLVNYSSLGNETGIDTATVKAWLSILQTSFIIFLLQPHHNNFNKRLVKQPKLYFYDTGIASYFLGIKRPEDLLIHYMRGNLFENFVINELIKFQYSQGNEHNLFFWRNNHGNEVDIIIDQGTELIPIEIKSSQTINHSFYTGIKYWQSLSKTNTSYIIYGGDTNRIHSDGITLLGWKDINKIPFLKYDTNPHL